MAGSGSRTPAMTEAALKLARDAAAAASTDVAEVTVAKTAGMPPFLENFLLRSHLRCQLNKNHLTQFRRVYKIPAPYSLRLPLNQETSKSFPNNTICLFSVTLVLGLRLPLVAPIVDLMNHTGCVPAMFSPNALPLLLAAYNAFEQEGLPWSIPNFFSLFSTCMNDEFLSFKARYIDKFSILGFPSSHSKWKSKYFFVSNPEGFLFDVNPGFASADVFEKPSTMDPAIVEYLETPRQLHTRDLLPPFLNPSGSEKAEVLPRGSRARARAQVGSGGEGGSTHTPQEESTHKVAQEASTSQAVPRKRPNQSQAEAGKALKTVAGSSAGGTAQRSSDLDTVPSAEEEGVGDPGNVGGPDEEGYDLPTLDMPITQLGDYDIAMVKRFHNRPTQAMSGILTTFPLQVGDAIRSRADTVLRQRWPRDEVGHRVMEHGLDAYNSLFYMCQVYTQQRGDIERIEEEKKELVKKVELVEEEKKKLTRKVEQTDNLRGALVARTASLEADVTRLSDQVTALNVERDHGRDELKLLREELEREASTSKVQAEAAAQVEIDSLRKTVESLRAAHEKDGIALAAALAKVREVEETMDKNGKELVELRMKMSNPHALQKLYAGSSVHADEMEHFMSEGFIMTRDYLRRDVIKEGMSMEALSQHLDELDYETVRDADAAAESSSEEGVEGENST